MFESLLASGGVPSDSPFTVSTNVRPLVTVRLICALLVGLMYVPLDLASSFNAASWVAVNVYGANCSQVNSCCAGSLTVDPEPCTEIVLSTSVPSDRRDRSRIVTPALLAQLLSTPGAAWVPSTDALPVISSEPATVSAPGKFLAGPATLLSNPSPPAPAPAFTCTRTTRWAVILDCARAPGAPGMATPSRTTCP